MPPVISEEEALQLQEAFESLPTNEEKRQAAELIHGYEQAQDAAGKPHYENFHAQKAESFDSMRKTFTDTETHGLEPDKLEVINRHYENDPRGKESLFNKDYLSHVTGLTRETVGKELDSLRRSYAKQKWNFDGAEIDNKEFYRRVGQDFKDTDAIREQAVKSAYLDSTGFGLVSDIQAQNKENENYKGRETEWQGIALQASERINERLLPHRQTVAAMVEDLGEKMGVDSAQGESKSWAEFTETLMEIPKEDLDFVIASIMAQGEAKEADSKDDLSLKSVAFTGFGRQKVAENFARGARDLGFGAVDGISRPMLVSAETFARTVNFIPDGMTLAQYAIEQTSKSVDSTGSDAIGDAFGKSLKKVKNREVTDEDREQAKIDLDRILDAQEVHHKIRQIADGSIDPAVSESAPIQGVYDAARSIPYTLSALAGPAGFMVTSAALADDSYYALKAANPDMSREQLTFITTAMGPVQAATERFVSGKILMGKAPTLGRLMNSAILTKKGVVGRVVLRAVEGTAMEVTQENLQDLTPHLFQSALAAINNDFPDVDWQSRWKDLEAGQEQIFWATLPLSLIGAGGGTFSDFSNAKALAMDTDSMVSAGFSEALASEVKQALESDNESKAESLMRKGLREEKLDSKPIQQARAESSKGAAEIVQRKIAAVEKAEHLEILPILRKEGEKFTIELADETRAEFDTREEANNARFAYAEEHGLRVNAENKLLIEQLSKFDEEGREKKYVFSAEPKNLLEATEQGVDVKGLEGDVNIPVSREQALERAEIDEEISVGDEVEQGKTDQELEADVNAEYEEAFTRAEVQALSENDRLGALNILGVNVTQFKDKVSRTTIKLFQGATTLDVIEETLEGDAAVMIRDDRRDFLVNSLRQIERDTGEKLFLNRKSDADLNKQDIQEGFAALGKAYFVGKSSANIRKMLRSPLKGMLTAYDSLFKAVWKRAVKINRLRRAGKLDAELERELNRSLGFGEDAENDAAIQKEAENLFTSVSEEIGEISNPDNVEDAGFEGSNGASFSVVKGFDDSYRIQHQGSSEDARLDSLSELMGDDIYGPNALQYFGVGQDGEKEAIEIFKATKGNADFPVTIYRVVPSFVNEINPGDWVTISKSAADSMNHSDFLGVDNQGKPQKSKIISKEVKAGEIVWPGDSLVEQSYAPEGASFSVIKAREKINLAAINAAESLKEKQDSRKGLKIQWLENSEDPDSVYWHTEREFPNDESYMDSEIYDPIISFTDGEWMSSEGSLYDSLEEAIESEERKIREDYESTGTAGVFSSNSDARDAAGEIFDAFPNLDIIKESWQGSKWGSHYLTLKTGEKLSIRDHGATRKDMGIPDFSYQVGKDWNPEEVANGLNAALDWILENVESLTERDVSLIEQSSPVDSGDIVPLSKRFDSSRDEISFSVIKARKSSLRLKMTREKMKQAIMESSDWKDFYERHEELLVEYFGPDAALFQRILSATSQAASVKANVSLALRAYGMIKRGEDLAAGWIDKGKQKKFLALKNLQKIVNDEEKLSGRKIGNYEAASTGDTSKVVVDRHVARMLFGVDSPTKAQFEKAEKVLTEIANEIGWEPRQVQAAIWAASIRKSNKEPESYDSYLRRLKREGTLDTRIGPGVQRGRRDNNEGAGRGSHLGESDGNAPGGVSFSVIKTSKHLRNDPRFSILVEEGRVETGVDIDKFTGMHIVGHSPDNAFAGSVEFEGGGRVDGKGGAYYPVLFANLNYFWASTKSAAKSMAELLNEIGRKNGGKILMALVSAPVEKLFSSTTMSVGTVTFFESLATQPRKTGVTKDSLNRMITKASQTKIVTKTKKKVKDPVTGENMIDPETGEVVTEEKIKIVEFSRKLMLKSGLDENLRLIKEILQPRESIFAIRKAFVESLATQLATQAKKNKGQEAYIAEMLAGPENKFANADILKGKLSKAAILQGLGDLFTEPFLREFQSYGNGQVYSVIEVDGEVEAIESGEHESYPFAIVPKDPNAIVKTNVLKEAYDWQDVLGHEKTGQGPVTFHKKKDGKPITVTMDYRHNTARKTLFPTSGISKDVLKVMGKPVEQQGNPLSFSVITNLDERISEMFSPFERSPNLRREVSKSLKRRLEDISRKIAPIFAANKTKKYIEEERKIIEGDLMNEKLNTLSASQVAAMDSQEALDDPALRPMLSDLLSKGSDGKWRGSLESKSAARKRGVSLNEWNDMPEGLPPYVWGGSLSPDQAADQFGFGSIAEFWNALESEIESFRSISKDAKSAKDEIKALEKEAREESQAWATEQHKNRKEIGNDRNTLIAAMRTLQAIVGAMPMEVRGKIGGFVKLSTLKGPKALLDELQKISERADRELERFIKKEETERIEKLFDRAKETKTTRGIPKAKLPADITDEVNKIKKLSELSKKEYDLKVSELSDKLEASPETSEETMEEMIRLMGFGHIKGMKSDQLGDFANNLELLIEKGRLIKKVLDEAHKAEVDRVVEIVNHDITGGKGLLTPTEAKARAKHRKKLGADALRGIHRRNVSFEWLMNGLSRENKDVGTLESDTHKVFSVMVHNATQAEKRANLKAEKAIRKFMSDLYGKTGVPLNKEILKLSEEVEKTGVFWNYYGLQSRTSKREIRVSNVQAAIQGKVKPDSLGFDAKEWNAIKLAYAEMEQSAKVKGRELTGERIVRYEVENKGKREEKTLSQDQAINLLMLYRQEGIKESMIEEGYSPATMEQMEEFLTPESKAIRDWLSQYYDDNYNALNQVFREQNGVSLPKIDFYSPAVRKAQGTEKEMAINSQGGSAMTTTPSFFISRVKNFAKMDESVGALNLYAQHVAQTNHYIEWAKPMKLLRGVFGNAEVKKNIEDYRGRDLLKLINERLEWFADGGNRAADYIGFLDTLRANFTFGALAYNWAVGIKQLTSLPAYAYDMPLADFVKYQAKFMAGLVPNVKEMLATDYVKTRWAEGYERDVIEGLRGDGGWIKTGLQTGMIVGKAGDIMPVIAGGWMAKQRAYDLAIKDGMSEKQAEAQSIIAFEMSTDRAQQAGSLKDLSSFQGKGSMARLFTMFKTSPRQYYANVYESALDAKAGKKGAKKEFARRLFIGQIILPLTFQLVSDLLRSPFNDDEDEDYEGGDYIRAMLMGPLNGLFIFGDFAELLSSGFSDTKIWFEELPIFAGPTKIAQGMAEFWDGDFEEGVDDLLRGMGKALAPFTYYEIIRREIDRLGLND